MKCSTYERHDRRFDNTVRQFLRTASLIGITPKADVLWIALAEGVRQVYSQRDQSQHGSSEDQAVQEHAGQTHQHGPHTIALGEVAIARLALQDGALHRGDDGAESTQLAICS